MASPDPGAVDPEIARALEALPSGAVIGIWARSEDGMIGRGGTMPWRAPEDMAQFAAVTWGHPVIVGRRTWDSIPPRFRPFAGRTTHVVTSSPATAAQLEADGALPEGDLPAALDHAASGTGNHRRWLAGGGTLYTQALDAGLLDAALVTVLDVTVPDGDTAAPALGDGFALAAASPSPTGFHPSARGPAYRFELYTRAAQAPRKDA